MFSYLAPLNIQLTLIDVSLVFISMISQQTISHDVAIVVREARIHHFLRCNTAFLYFNLCFLWFLSIHWEFQIWYLVIKVFILLKLFLVYDLRVRFFVVDATTYIIFLLLIKVELVIHVIIIVIFLSTLVISSFFFLLIIQVNILFIIVDFFLIQQQMGRDRIVVIISIDIINLQKLLLIYDVIQFLLHLLVFLDLNLQEFH